MTCKSGCEYLSDVAEYLDITVQFLIEALRTFKEKYGLIIESGNM
ncbi:MAG: hypothetical protein VB119_06870 [Candidatus Metalachnospira sp.]|nr:hypothetical protein [Candidatus Metalachnospira sp.]